MLRFVFTTQINRVRVTRERTSQKESTKEKTNLLCISTSPLPLSYRDVQCEPTSSEILYRSRHRKNETNVLQNFEQTAFVASRHNPLDVQAVVQRDIVKRSRVHLTRFLTFSLVRRLFVSRIERQPAEAFENLFESYRTIRCTLRSRLDSSGPQKFSAIVLHECLPFSN